MSNNSCIFASEKNRRSRLAKKEVGKDTKNRIDMFWFLLGIAIVVLGAYIVFGILGLVFQIIMFIISGIFNFFFDN